MGTNDHATQDSIDPLDVLTFDEKTGKRATHEEFEFAPLGDGRVRVTNASYGSEKDEHEYVVSIVSGIPTDCTCPAWLYGEGACKHMVAVALAGPVRDAAGDRPLVTDGGQDEECWCIDSDLSCFDHFGDPQPDPAED